MSAYSHVWQRETDEIREVQRLAAERPALSTPEDIMTEIERLKRLHGRMTSAMHRLKTTTAQD